MVESRRKGAPRSTRFSFGRWTRPAVHFYKLHGYLDEASAPEAPARGGKPHRKFHETAEIRQQLTCAPWRGGPISFYREQVSLARYCYRCEYISATDATWMPSQTRCQTWKFLVKKNPPFPDSPVHQVPLA